MSVTDKIKMVMASAGISGRGLASAFDCTPQSASTKINRGVKSVDDLVKIVDFCGASIAITTKNGTVIPLTLEDLEGGK